MADKKPTGTVAPPYSAGAAGSHTRTSPRQNANPGGAWATDGGNGGLGTAGGLGSPEGMSPKPAGKPGRTA